MTDNQSESDVTSEITDVTTSESDVTKATKTTRLNVTDIEWLQEEAVGSESPAAVLSRLHDELLTSRDQEIVLNAAIKEYGAMVSQLNSDLENLRLGSPTAVTAPASQQTLGEFGGGAIKETIDTIKDFCDDETVCVKTALHLIDKKADMVDKSLDRVHSENQKQLDREDKDKDRQLKIDLAAKRAQHEVDMAMIKKGIVQEKDLEGTIFLGSTEKRRTAGEMLAERKKAAYHAADGDKYDGELVDDGEADYGDVVDD